jgi:hypothetical protein
LAAASAPSSRTSFTVDDGRIVNEDDNDTEEEDDDVKTGPPAAEAPEEDP